MLSEIAIEEEQAFGLQFEEHRVDELHHVEAPESWQETEDAGIEAHASQPSRGARHIDVPWVVLPEVAIGANHHIVAQRMEAFRQRSVDIAIFAKQ